MTQPSQKLRWCLWLYAIDLVSIRKIFKYNLIQILIQIPDFNICCTRWNNLPCSASCKRNRCVSPKRTTGRRVVLASE